MAYNGIAATLLPSGRTLHNRFGLPVPLFSNSKSTIKTTHFKKIEEIRNTDVFVIDEISSAPKHAMRIMDEVLREIMSNDLPFGGKVVLWGGDFRQTIPVQKHASPAQLIDLCVNRWDRKSNGHWEKFKQFRSHFVLMHIY